MNDFKAAIFLYHQWSERCHLSLTDAQRIIDQLYCFSQHMEFWFNDVLPNEHKSWFVSAICVQYIGRSQLTF